MAHPSNSSEQQPDAVQVMTQAAGKAASLMGLNKATLARVLGISPASAGRMYTSAYQLNPNAKEWDMARLLIRLFRSLDAIMAGDEQALRSWLQSPNHALNAKPIELMTNAAGLVHTLDYVDAYRARI